MGDEVGQYIMYALNPNSFVIYNIRQCSLNFGGCRIFRGCIGSCGKVDVEFLEDV